MDPDETPRPEFAVYDQPPTLYWSEDGAVTCAEHAPYEGSDTWLSGRWMRMSAAARDAWREEVGTPARCEICPRPAR
jgi:hypothetical protein